MFEEAGLDPDSPPTSWERSATYAKQIADATGQAGFAQLSQGNTGGWMLTALTYANGGRMQEGTGDEVEATIDNEGTVKALEFLESMRWEDNSMGSNFLFEWGTINQAFAAGQVGMYMSGSDVYNSLVTENEVDPASYGLTILPLEGDDSGVLGGGSVAAIRADASDAEKEAGVKWIDFFYMEKLTDEAAAVADAEALAASDAPIGTPALPIFGAEQLAKSDAWVADFVNVPLEQMMPFKEPHPRAAAGARAGGADAGDVRHPRLGRAGRAHRGGRRHPGAARRGRRRGDGAHPGELTWVRSGAGRAGPRRPFSAQGPQHVRAGPADAARLRLLRVVADDPGRRAERAVERPRQRRPEWVGLDNFRRVLDDPLLWTAIKNTLWFTLLALVFGYPIPIILAVVMNELSARQGPLQRRSPTCPS